MAGGFELKPGVARGRVLRRGSLAKAGAEAGVLLTEGAEFGCEILLGGDEVRMSHVRGRALFNEVEGHLAAHPHVAAVAQGYESSACQRKRFLNAMTTFSSRFFRL